MKVFLKGLYHPFPIQLVLLHFKKFQVLLFFWFILFSTVNGTFMKTFGADSFAGRMASILQGSSDTTFYVVAVYFGSVSIKNTRYSIGAMLLADLVGIITAIGLCYLFFG